MPLPTTITLAMTGKQYRLLWEVDYESESPTGWQSIAAAERRRHGRGWIIPNITLTAADAFHLRRYAVSRAGAAAAAGDHADARAMDDLVDRIDDGFNADRYTTATYTFVAVRR